MKKNELIERVQKKIDELGTLFDREIYYPDGTISGKIRLADMGHYIFIYFGLYIKTIGCKNKNPESVVEKFYNDYKFN